MDRFLTFFQKYIYSKSYVLMDLEFMILDTFDKMRPSLTFKKFENLQQAEEACKKIEEFENECFKTGSTSEQKVGTENLMLMKDQLRYEDLIDSLTYEFNEDQQAEKEKPRDKFKKQRQKQNKKIQDKIFDSEEGKTPSETSLQDDSQRAP